MTPSLQGTRGKSLRHRSISNVMSIMNKRITNEGGFVENTSPKGAIVRLAKSLEGEVLWVENE